MTRNPYLLFLTKVFLFLALMFVIDRAAGALLEHFFLKMTVGKSARTTYALEKMNEDLIVFGSSRASHHYVSQTIRDSLGMSVYNAGRDGMGMSYGYAVFKAMMRRHKPRVIVIDLFIDLNKDAAHYDRLAVLLPYYRRHEEVRSVVELRGPYERVKTISQLYHFNSTLLTMIANSSIRRNEIHDHGYIPLQGRYTSPIAEMQILSTDKTDSTKAFHFVRMVEEARRSGIEVYVVVSPVYFAWEEPPAGVRWAKKYCADNGVKFKDYSQLPYFLSHREWFSHPSHLNHDGALAFTSMLCSDIKNGFCSSGNEPYNGGLDTVLAPLASKP